MWSYVDATERKSSYNTVRRWSGRSGWWGLWHLWRSGCCPSPQSESLPPMKGHWGFFYRVRMKGTLSGFLLTDTVGLRCASDPPVRRPPSQNFPGLLGADSTVRWVLWIFTVCSRDLNEARVGFVKAMTHWCSLNYNQRQLIDVNLD